MFLFKQKYGIYNFNDIGNKTCVDVNVNTVYDEFVYKDEMCKEIMNMRDGLVEAQCQILNVVSSFVIICKLLILFYALAHKDILYCFIITIKYNIHLFVSSKKTTFSDCLYYIYKYIFIMYVYILYCHNHYIYH